MRHLERSESYRQKVECWLSGAGGGENGEFAFIRYKVSILQDTKSSGDGWGVTFAQHCERT